MIRSKLLMCASLGFVLLTSGCQEDPEAAANSLFVEASTSMQQADAVTGTSLEDLSKRRDLLATAVTNLDKIVESYPSASLAVDLASAGSAKGVVVAEVKQQLEMAQRDLECAEKGSEGNCAVEALIANELSRDSESKARSTFVLLAVSNKSWESAFELALSIKDDEDSQLESLAKIAIFAALFNEVSVKERVLELMPERDKDDAERFFSRFNDDLKKADWKLSVDLAPTFTVQSAPEIVSSEGSSDGFTDLVVNSLEGADIALKSGDMEAFRSKVVGSFVLLDAALAAGNEIQANNALTLIDRDLERAFNSAFR